MVILEMLEKLRKNACEKSCEQNSQLIVHFLGFYLYKVLVFVYNFISGIVFAFFQWFCTPYKILLFFIRFLLFQQK